MIKMILFIVISIVGGLLGTLGGAKGISKGIRRIAIPLIITLFSLYILRNAWCITIMFMSFVLAMGYGMPDIQDAGSSLGRFWARIFPYHVLLKTPKDLKLRLLAGVFTRITIGLLICLSMLSIVILRRNWGIFTLSSIGIMGVFGAISWRSLGQFEFKGKQLLWSEFWSYFVVIFMAQIMIKL